MCSNNIEPAPKKALNEIINTKITGVSTYYLKTEEGTPTIKIPLINLSDLVDGTINNETVRTEEIRDTGKMDINGTVQEGDVVLALRGPPFRSAVVSGDVAGAALSANLVGLRCSDQIKPEFLAAWFNSSAGQRAILTLISGSALMCISLRTLSQIEIPVPSKEQQEVLSRYIELTNKHSRILKKEQELMDSIVDTIMIKYGEKYD